MAYQPIGRVERLLALPASTLRFWEREIALVAPRKDMFGRRLFSFSDIGILLRLKHLALVRGYGIGKAGRILELERTTADAELRADLAEIRGNLVTLYFDALELGERLDETPTATGNRAVPG